MKPKRQQTHQQQLQIVKVIQNVLSLPQEEINLIGGQLSSDKQLTSVYLLRIKRVYQLVLEMKVEKAKREEAVRFLQFVPRNALRQRPKITRYLAQLYSSSQLLIKIYQSIRRLTLRPIPGADPVQEAQRLYDETWLTPEALLNVMFGSHYFTDVTRAAVESDILPGLRNVSDRLAANFVFNKHIQLFEQFWANILAKQKTFDRPQNEADIAGIKAILNNPYQAADVTVPLITENQHKQLFDQPPEATGSQKAILDQFFKQDTVAKALNPLEKAKVAKVRNKDVQTDKIVVVKPKKERPRHQDPTAKILPILTQQEQEQLSPQELQEQREAELQYQVLQLQNDLTIEECERQYVQQFTKSFDSLQQYGKKLMDVKNLISQFTETEQTKEQISKQLLSMTLCCHNDLLPTLVDFRDLVLTQVLNILDLRQLIIAPVDTTFSVQPVLQLAFMDFTEAVLQQALRLANYPHENYELLVAQLGFEENAIPLLIGADLEIAEFQHFPHAFWSCVAKAAGKEYQQVDGANELVGIITNEFQMIQDHGRFVDKCTEAGMRLCRVPPGDKVDIFLHGEEKQIEVPVKYQSNVAVDDYFAQPLYLHLHEDDDDEIIVAEPPKMVMENAEIIEVPVRPPPNKRLWRVYQELQGGLEIPEEIIIKSPRFPCSKKPNKSIETQNKEGSKESIELVKNESKDQIGKEESKESTNSKDHCDKEQKKDNDMQLLSQHRQEMERTKTETLGQEDKQEQKIDTKPKIAAQKAKPPKVNMTIEQSIKTKRIPQELKPNEKYQEVYEEIYEEVYEDPSIVSDVDPNEANMRDQPVFIFEQHCDAKPKSTTKHVSVITQPEHDETQDVTNDQKTDKK